MRRFRVSQRHCCMPSSPPPPPPPAGCRALQTDSSSRYVSVTANYKHSCVPTTCNTWILVHVLSLFISRSYTVYILSFQLVLHDWYNKGRGMCYPVCGMVHIKEPLLLIGKSSLCGGSGFPFSLSEWSLTICLTPYNRR